MPTCYFCGDTASVSWFPCKTRSGEDVMLCAQCDDMSFWNGEENAPADALALSIREGQAPDYDWRGKED